MGIFEEKIKPHLKSETPAFGKIDAQTLVECAEQIGQKLSSDKEETSKNQLRKFYNAVKQIEHYTLRWDPDEELSDDLIAQLLFLRPHLANAQHKNPKNAKIQILCNVLNPCLASNVIEKKADLTRFVKFFEAIVAYAD
jgi:CRISPR type III-A-associated protein Csm2